MLSSNKRKFQSDEITIAHDYQITFGHEPSSGASTERQFDLLRRE